MSDSGHAGKDSGADIHQLYSKEGDRPFNIPSEQIERIIARANVLQDAAGRDGGRQLSPEELVSIGSEVGLSPEHVRRAIAEYRAETLAPPAPEDRPLTRKILGEAFVRVRRVIPGTPETIHHEFERRMREDELMTPVRRRGTESVWRQNASLKGKLQRGLDFSGREYELSTTDSVSMALAPASDDSSLITLTADLTNQRKDSATNWAVALAVVWIVAVPSAFGIDAWGWLTIPAGIAATAGIVVTTRMSLADKRRRVGLVLEGMLDQLEARRWY